MAEQITSASSQQLGTDCKECIFFCNTEEAPKDNDTFTFDIKHCKLGKISKFEEAGASFEERDGKFLINRVCNFRRTEEWQEDKSMEDCVESVKEEVKITGTIVVYAKSIEDIDKCVSKLSKIKHVENFKIIIAHYSELLVREVFDYIQSQNHFEEIFAVQVNDAEVHTGQIHFLDEALKRAKNGFIFSIDAEKDFDGNIIDKIYHFLYEKMQKLLYVEETEEINGSVVMAVIYKFLKGNKFWSFKEKMEAMAKNQGIESQITSWDKINEEYTN